MVNWLIIAVVCVALVIFFKFSSVRYERVWTYIIAGLLIFFIFSFISVSQYNELDFKTFDGATDGVKTYFTWLWGFGKNTARITGNIVNVDWKGNYTNVEK
jgi:glucan phosphoethanolaminetransferase (alkaline phosphatase superfamily)